jgi:NAD(P)-dependent dehydrogenase (short-subunit alcohol dehydrogenase family)
MPAESAATLAGRVVVITGAARGMGQAYARAFAKAGVRLVATDRSWKGAEDFAKELGSLGKEVLTLDMDVTDGAAIDRAFESAMARFGTIDVLINNAAMRQRDLFPPSGRTTTLETRDEDWERAFAVNVFGALKVIRRFIRPMLAQKRGSIINAVSSGILSHSQGGAYRALRPNSREMPYQSTKAALATMSFYLADEVRESNVAVNIVIPGHTRTTGFEEQNRARMASGMRTGPQPLVPEHIVPIVLHLAAQDASTVTGRMFDVMQWNLEHGLGGQDAWTDRSFSYEALVAKS